MSLLRFLRTLLQPPVSLLLGGRGRAPTPAEVARHQAEMAQLREELARLRARHRDTCHIVAQQVPPGQGRPAPDLDKPL